MTFILTGMGIISALLIGFVVYNHCRAMSDYLKGKDDAG